MSINGIGAFRLTAHSEMDLSLPSAATQRWRRKPGHYCHRMELLPRHLDVFCTACGAPLGGLEAVCSYCKTPGPPLRDIRTLCPGCQNCSERT